MGLLLSPFLYLKGFAMQWGYKVRLFMLVWKIAHLGWCFFMYEELPKHLSKKRAKWSKYLTDEGYRYTSHRANLATIPAMSLVAELRKEYA